MRLRRRNSASPAMAARVTVGRHTPGRLRIVWFVLGLIAGSVLCLSLTYWLRGRPEQDMRADLQQQAATLRARLSADRERLSEQVQTLTRENTASRAELERLQGLVDASDSRIRIEQTTASQLGAQLRTLEADNVRLKGDLMYLESLLPSSEGEGLLEIRGLQVLPDSVPRQMLWRAMLVQGGRKSRSFSGHLQLVIKYELDRKMQSLLLPKRNGGDGDSGLKVSFDRYQRVEGRFTLPAGAVLKSVQLRVLRGSAVQAQQSLSM